MKINFNESFKNIATYFFYFDRSDFIYTGKNGINELVMCFNKSTLASYNINDLQYPQKFANYSLAHRRLSKEANDIINENKNYIAENSDYLNPGFRFKL